MEEIDYKIPDLAGKLITFDKDIEYFTQYPSPLIELLQSTHFTNINSTITFFGPMLYFLVRALGCEKILEIGHAEGYTAYYLAHALKDNGIRYGMKENMYYGIDIAQTEKVDKNLTEANLPHIIYNLDSMRLPGPLKDITFDLIFQDGNHDTEHIVYEMKTMYHQLKGDGKGYWIFHDCFGPAEEAWHTIIKDPMFKWEYCRIFCVYGLAILRKMDGFDEDKRYWSDK